MVQCAYVANELRKAPFLLTSCLRTLLIFAWQLVSTEQYRAIVVVMKTLRNVEKEKAIEVVNKMKQMAGLEIWELAVRLAELMGNPKWVFKGVLDTLREALNSCPDGLLNPRAFVKGGGRQ
jgi:hypothetical protein